MRPSADNSAADPTVNEESNVNLYEVRATTWVAGIVVGAILAFGLLVAGDNYVRTARGDLPDKAPVRASVAQN